MKLVLHRSLATLSLLTAITTLGCTADDSDDLDQATLEASLAVNEDGSDAETTDSVEGEPLLLRGCAEPVLRRHLEEGASGRSRPEPLVGGPPDAPGVGALGGAGNEPKRPNARRMRAHRLALFSRIYDADQNGTLEPEEREVLRSDLDARCAAKEALLVASFDEDADGQLDDAEWELAHAALRARFEARRAEVVARFDADEDGVLDPEERSAAHEAVRQFLDARREAEIAFYDSDDSGDLDDTERAALVLALRARVRGEHWDDVLDAESPVDEE